MQFIHTENLFAQRHITVHGRHVFADRIDQIVIDLYQDVLPCHGHGTGGIIVPHRRLRSRAFDSTCIGGGKGIDMLAIPLVIAFKGMLTQCTVGGHLQGNIVRPCHFHRLSVPILHGIEHHIRILQVVGDFRRSPQGLPESGQDLFLRGRQGVGFCRSKFSMVNL